MKRFAFFLFLSALFISTAAAQSTIFIVRHAEKVEGGGNDPDLSDAGRARAESLAHTLKDADISAIYVTELTRTQQTAAPLAKLRSIDPTIVPAKDSAALIATLRASTGNALVVGHSNTVPDLIKAFGIATPIQIADGDYDNLFVLVLDEKPRLTRLHYR
jgi:broad specificity phosphatase PhoE